MHTHTWTDYKDYFPLLLANGVTGVREMFGDMETVKRIRKEINTEEINGPIIYSSGLIIDGNPPDHNGSAIAETPEEGREIVRQQIANGAEFIKVYSNLKPDVYYAIADECKKQGIPLNGHIPTKISLKEAIASGHQGAEHFHGILEYAAGFFEPKTLDSLNASDFNIYDFFEKMSYVLDHLNDKNTQETVQLLSSNSSWVCPTLVVIEGSKKYMNPTTPLDDRLQYMPDNSISTWGLEPWEANDESRKYLNLYKRRYKEITSLIHTLNQNKVRFLAGTDYTNPHTYPGFSLHDELEAFVRDCGFSTLEALQTATLNPAIFMKKEAELGTVEINKLANLVLLDKNPLEDISNTKTIEAVIVSEKYLEGEKLRDDLKAIAIENKKPKIKEALSKLIEEQGIEAAINEFHKLKATQPDAYNFTGGRQLNGLGYQLLRNGKFVEAIAILKLNPEMFPDDANAYDSLGDAYTAQ
ncbi:MAG: amidohydrolase family protein [Xanthomarina gelatinilytica]|uniref:amidohydrolase family protein n=1 Tax=Xanthomarina gelatinilytica TaxID=1137281 RepID=UPI003A8B00FF